MFLIQTELFKSFFSEKFFSEAMLTKNERLLTFNWSEKRITEFSTGRYCAREALTPFELGEQDILVGTNREPLWPAGIIGSISHCDNFVGAVIASTTTLKAIGLDIETIGKVGLELWDLVFTPSEQSFLRTLEPTQISLYSTVLFSAKECFYKLQFPLTRTYIDFKDVEIAIDGGSLQLSFVKEFTDMPISFNNVTLKFITHTTEVITYGYML